MEIKDLYESPPRRNYDNQELIEPETLEEHFDSIKKAYEQAGLSPADSSKLCPGLVSNDDRFQIELWMTGEGEILGSRFLLCNTDETLVNEGDIMMWNNRFEMGSGRSISPPERTIHDYHIPARSVRALSEFINEQAASGNFQPVERKSLLSLPQ